GNTRATSSLNTKSGTWSRGWAKRRSGSWLTTACWAEGEGRHCKPRAASFKRQRILRSLQLVGKELAGALNRRERVLLHDHAAYVGFAVADLVHQHVVDQYEHGTERPALHLAALAEVEQVGPEAADPLGVGLGELEGVADAAVLGLQALDQAVRQVGDGDVG